MKNLIKKFTVLLLLIVAISIQDIRAQEVDEAMINMTEFLDLSDKQTDQVQTLIAQYRTNMDDILLKYDGEEEPDVPAMIGEVRDLRDNYRKDLQTILSKDQYDKYLAEIDVIMNDMFKDLAEIRLMDIQEEGGINRWSDRKSYPCCWKGTETQRYNYSLKMPENACPCQKRSRSVKFLKK